METNEKLEIDKREEIIERIITILKERPEEYMAGELCAEALNRMLKNRNAICQVRFLWKLDNDCPCGI